MSHMHTNKAHTVVLPYGILKIYKIMYGIGNGWGGQNIPVP